MRGDIHSFPAAAGSGERLALDDHLPYRLSMAAGAVSRLVARAYEDRFGLAIPEWRVLAVLAEGEAMTSAAVAARTSMDKAAVRRAVHGLARRCLVARKAHEADARSHRLSLTGAGRRLYADIVPLALAYEAALLSGLGVGESKALKSLLQRLESAAAKLVGEG